MMTKDTAQPNRPPPPLLLAPRLCFADGSRRTVRGTVRIEQRGAAALYTCAIRLRREPAQRLDHVELFRSTWAEPEIEFFRQGFYMPSDRSLFAVVRAGEPAPLHPRWRPPGLGDFDFWSFNLLGWKIPGTRRFRLMGFTSAHRFEGRFVVHTQERKLRLSCRCGPEAVPINPGAAFDLEPLLVIEGNDWNACLETYAREAARQNGARVAPSTTMGWIDWQYYRERKTEDDILRSARALSKARRAGMPGDVIIVDGGWCNHASEWLEPCAKFPSGMATLCRKIRRMGLVPGLWLAPYFTNVNTRVVREHPEWLVSDSTTGEPLRGGPESPVGDYRVIDYSVPAALDWLHAIVRTFVRDWGIGYLKLDGPRYSIYHGGRFHDSTRTASEVIRTSLETIRDACGETVRLEGEGCYLPSLGLVDIQRTQQDNWAYWQHPVTGGPGMRENLQDDLLSGFLHRRWWHNHRENVILRDWPSPNFAIKKQYPDIVEPVATIEERRSQITAMALTGGAMLLADPLEALLERPDLMRLAGTFLPPFEAARCEPVDVFNGRGAPEIYATRVERPFETWHVAAVFNWSDETRDIAVPIERICGPGRRLAFEFWTGTFLGIHAGALRLRRIPAHACRVVALRPVRRSPQLLGTNLHLFQGGVEIESCAFAKGTLRLSVKHFIDRDVTLWVRHPKAYTLRAIDTDARAHTIDARTPSVLAITFDGGPRTRIAFVFDR